jgi:hypothetical protein
MLKRLLVCAVTAVSAQAALKTIDNPQGGKIVYGQVEGASSEAGAMGAVLRALHIQFGDKPQVGRIFRVHGTNSVAAFFTVVKRSQGNAPLAGLVIAASFAAGDVEAAVMSDDAARFGSTINPMLKRLFGVWRPAAETPASAPASGDANTAKAAPLRQFVLPDRSASVSLPEGWNVLPSSAGGTILAQGPNGETVSLGFPFLAMNSSDPRVARTQQWAQQGGGRNTSYAQSLYYPYGADLAKTFVDLTQMWRGRKGLPPATFQIASEDRVQAPASERCAHITGQVDAQDGKGLKEMNSVFCQGPLAPHGSYMNIAYHTAVPMQFAPKERAAMAAILASFNVNMAIVEAQAGALAAPAIAAIHEIGRRAAQQAADAHAANDRYNRGVEQRGDSRDKRNQAFSNYLLDQTVIQDNELNAHGTVWNQTADSLVRNNPQRYEYVDTPNFWKGIDY